MFEAEESQTILSLDGTAELSCLFSQQPARLTFLTKQNLQCLIERGKFSVLQKKEK